MTEEEAIEHERRVICQLPDGTEVRQDRFRYSYLSPWVEGTCEVYCGPCEDQVDEATNAVDAQIKMLTHALMHCQEELNTHRASIVSHRHADGTRAP